MRINYSSYAHAIEKGMNKRKIGLAQILFKFMCDHEGRELLVNAQLSSNTKRRLLDWIVAAGK